MKKTLSAFFRLLLLTTLLTGCRAIYFEHLPASAYPQTTILTRNTAQSFDQTWTRLMKLVADHDLSVKAVDKGSGYFQSDILSFVRAYRIINVKDSIAYPVYVLVERDTVYNFVVNPTYITGYLKVQVISEKDSTRLQVSIQDLKNYRTPDYYQDVTTTLTLENEVADYLTAVADSIPMNIIKGRVINPEDNYARYEQKQDRAIRGGVWGTVVGVVLGIVIAVVAIVK